MSVQEEQQVSELAEKDKLAVDRLTALFDDGAFTEIDGYAKSASGDVEARCRFRHGEWLSRLCICTECKCKRRCYQCGPMRKIEKDL